MQIRTEQPGRSLAAESKKTEQKYQVKKIYKKINIYYLTFLEYLITMFWKDV